MAASDTSFLIRPVRPDEYEALGELLVAAFHSLPPLMTNQDAHDRELRNVARRAQTSSVLVAVTPTDELLGGVTYVRGPEDPYSRELRPGEAGMRMLGVRPGCQGRGVGRALTEACLDRARTDGRARLRLYTASWMLAAQHLYERLGFYRVPDLDFPSADMLAYAADLEAGA